MTVELIGFITLGIGFASFFVSSSFLVCVFFFTTILGSAAAFVLDSLGGTNISPAHLLLGFVAIRLLSDHSIRKRIFEGILPGRPGFWLLLTALYSAMSAYLMPRLFEGETYVYAVRMATPYEVPLAPAMANFTQSVYLIADCVCFVLLYGYGGDAAGQRSLRTAAICCVILNLIFAGLDLITYATGTTELLSFIRNANYSLISEAELGGMKRIVGSHIEASSFAAATLGYFAYTGRLWLAGIRPRLTLSLTMLSFFGLIFSTSSTAYVGIAATLLLGYFSTLLALFRGRTTRQANFFLIATPFIAVLVFLVVALSDSLSGPIVDMLNDTIFNKASSDSGIERSSWNAQALRVFVDTYGFGAGNGSLRTSSFPLAVLANLGIVGTTLFSLFFASLLFGRSEAPSSPNEEEATRLAGRSACVAWLIAGAISGALTDIGLHFFVFAPLACVRSSDAFYKKPIDTSAVADGA
jgi:hypothetical protein